MIYDIIGFFVTGIILGLSAGISPGPLLTLVITESLKHGEKAGIKVALAPLITDLPIIILVTFLLSKAGTNHLILAVIAFAGGAYLLYLAYENFNIKGIDAKNIKTGSSSLKKGVIGNFLNPHPYLFWLAIGSPMIIKSIKIHPAAAAAFLTGFYLLLAGSKIVIALLAGRSKGFIGGGYYILMIRILGILLGAFAVLLITDGIRMIIS